MNYSYWEHKHWFSNINHTIIGSGIVGLNCAIQLKKQQPNTKVLVLEKGMLPQGASTKNAGFACFGSLSELIDDLKTHTPEEVLNLVTKRWNGLQLLRQTLGDNAIDYQQNKGFELFLDKQSFNDCHQEMAQVNKLLHPIFKQDVFSTSNNSFKFENIAPNYIVNNLEGQIDTGKMMQALLKKAQALGVLILNNVEVTNFQDQTNCVHIQTKQFELKTNKLYIATNGFAKQLLNLNVEPARAQVLITKPIENLHIKGTFHLDKGYYYFRNIDNRILFGGARNLDFETENTTDFGQTSIIQDRLEQLLREVILPNQPFEIDRRWSGIMGVGNQKNTIVKQVSNNVSCAARLSGMGIAIGSLVGKELAEV